MIVGIATKFSSEINTKDTPKKLILSLLSLQLRFLNFKENKGISAINNTDITTVARIKSSGIAIQVLRELPAWNSVIKGKERKNKVFAGVGKPIKLSVCLSSTLNFANRYAEKAGIISAINE